MHYYTDVILPFSLPRLFTYHIPEEFKNEIQIGSRVLVEFGKRKIYTAIVSKIHNLKPKEYQTKPIYSLLDTLPVVTGKQLELWQWISQYYMCTLGDIFKAGIPSGLKLESEMSLYLNPDFEAVEPLNKNEVHILNMLSATNGLKANQVYNSLQIKNGYIYIKSLLSKNAISLEEAVKKGFSAKTETYILINKEFNNEDKLKELFEDLTRAKAQLRLVMSYISLTGMPDDMNYNKEIRKNRLLDYSKTTIQPLKELVSKGVFIEVEKEISRVITETKTQPLKELTETQQKALEKINSIHNEKQTALLHGITSSGKTEIYIHLIKKYIDEGKQVLYLLPEIALTTQIINRLRNVFGSRVGVYHSKFSDNERVEVYNGTLNNNGFKIILGVRSSVFLPFNNLGLVIIDEEHENTYKQFDPAPRYHARDTAIYLATVHNAKVLLGTATPSVESYFNARKGKYGLIELNERYQNILLPQIIISDTREAYKQKQMQSIFTTTMLNNIKHTLENKEQVILFKNRRGYAPYIECETCGWIPVCKNCDVTLTYHLKTKDLSCHYCGYSIQVPKGCNVCGNTSLTTRGYGTEKIEDELALFFPDAKISRMDLDTTRTRKSYEKIIDSFEKKETDILVGTQMISKGLDFDNVSLVGILNADSMLNFPDFRAHERSYQLMAQVSGRAGRKNKQGRVIIQTSDKTHPVITDVINNNYRSLFLRQIEERKQFCYPPYYRLIEIKIKHRDKRIVNVAAQQLSLELTKFFGNRIVGPEFPLIERIQNLFQKNILVKLEADKSLQKSKQIMQNVIQELVSYNAFKNIRIITDVDPM